MTSPSPTATETTQPAAGQQLAAALASDLRALADLIAAQPAMAEMFARDIRQQHIVARWGDPVGPQQIVDAAKEHGATETTGPRDVTGYPTKWLVFPHDTVRLKVICLDPSSVGRTQ